MQLAQLWDRLACLLYPPRCLFCGEVVEYDDPLCGPCAADAAAPQQIENCGSLASLLSPMPYEGGRRQVIWTLKKEPDARAVRYLCGRMLEQILASGTASPDLLVPVPSNPARMAERGFNQAQLLAEGLARPLALPVAADALVRLDGTNTQHRLPAQARGRNAAASYAAGNTVPVQGARCLLVDDVYTTGATLEACAALLHAAGAREVRAVAASYTPSPRAGGPLRVPPLH